VRPGAFEREPDLPGLLRPRVRPTRGFVSGSSGASLGGDFVKCSVLAVGLGGPIFGAFRVPTVVRVRLWSTFVPLGSRRRPVPRPLLREVIVWWLG
jgi:hypothetical protein